MSIKNNIFIFFCFFSTSCGSKFTQGERIYTSLCANCHMEDGSGLNKLIPALKGSKYLTGKNSDIVCIIRNGFNSDSLGLTMKSMPAHPKMTNVEMTNLVNYLQDAFGAKVELNLDEIDIANTGCKK